MNVNSFKLNNVQLQEISYSLYKKILEGLEKENTEIRCIPTYITPKTSEIRGKALALDLGGTNYRAAIVEFLNGNTPVLFPEKGWHKDLSVMKTEGYTREQLFSELADSIREVNERELPVGYCFSYPTESMINGDAKLIRWTKEINIQGMIGEFVGKTLIDYLNNINETHYSNIKVINDTVASLFSGVSHEGYDAYVGLVVGTGSNMATFIPVDKIKKLNSDSKLTGRIPVNLESGNFAPPYLTAVDDAVDDETVDKGQQRFEKAVSGVYLGEILQKTFPNIQFETHFDARKLTSMLNYSGNYKEEYINAARTIYTRSANLVAASLKGLIDVLLGFNGNIKRICLTAEGSLFWSEDRKGVNYQTLVYTKLHELLKETGHGDVIVDIKQIKNANLIGSAIAALS